MWVFGYGSLMWKSGFPFQTKLVGYINGYKRRFFQHSVDHRGRPDKPGRVVTLLPGSSQHHVWGVAYEILSEDEEEVMAHLDFREKTGYEKLFVMFHPRYVITNAHEEASFEPILADSDESPFELILYIATENNNYFAGSASIQEIAEQIVQSEGPSGTNKEYLYNLAESMRKMAPGEDDEHLFTLEQAVRELDAMAT